MTPKENFLAAWEREFQTTLKVFRSYPSHRKEFKPHEIARSAIDLAWTIVCEEKIFVEGVLSGEIKFGMPKTPETMDELISIYEKNHSECFQKVKNLPDSELDKTMKFMTAANTPADFKKIDLLWMIVLMDSIHHRGQFSVYLRMAGGKVPSIYGPSADEPWN